MQNYKQNDTNVLAWLDLQIDANDMNDKFDHNTLPYASWRIFLKLKNALIMVILMIHEIKWFLKTFSLYLMSDSWKWIENI